MKTQLRVFFLFAICIFITTDVFSQAQRAKQQPLPVIKYNSNVDAPLSAKELKFITEVYGDKTQEVVLNHSQRLKDIKNILRNRVKYQKIDDSKGFKESSLLSEVSLFDAYVSDLTRDSVFNPDTFNPLKYNFNFYSRGGEQYKVDNTNYYIFIISQHQDSY